MMNRTLSVALLPALLPDNLVSTQTCAVVIDVLRATTVMTTALAAGATQIETCGQIVDAFELAKQTDPPALLCGERECKPIDGFHFGNSPTEYTPTNVSQRRLVLTTTNGTRAIEAVAGCKRLLVSSFLNVMSTVRAVENESHLQIVCAGTNGQISAEDVLLAGCMVESLGSDDSELDDSARLARASWRELGQANQNPAGITQALRLSLGGRNLIKVGYGDDIARCAQWGCIDGTVERETGTDATFRFQRPPTSDRAS